MRAVVPHQLHTPGNAQVGIRITFTVGKKDRKERQSAAWYSRGSVPTGGHDLASMLLRGYLEETKGGIVSPELQFPNNGSLEGDLAPCYITATLSYWSHF